MLHSGMCFEGFIAVPGEGGGGTDVPLATSSFITLSYRFELGCSDVGWFLFSLKSFIQNSLVQHTSRKHTSKEFVYT